MTCSVPLQERLQEPVTYTQDESGNLLLANVLPELPCLPKKLAQPLRGLLVSDLVDLRLHFDVAKLTPPWHGLWRCSPLPRPMDPLTVCAPFPLVCLL